MTDAEMDEGHKYENGSHDGCGRRVLCGRYKVYAVHP